MKKRNQGIKRIAGTYPEFIFCEMKSFFLRSKIVKYYENADHEDIKTVVQTIRRSLRLSVFPYEFTKKYAAMDVEVYKDPSCGLLYVMDMGKKLYFKKKYFTPVLVRRYYRNLCMEQDKESPHCYLTDEFKPNSRSVIFDIGTAEGIFALRTIDSADKTYCFECDPDWVEALKMTFAPYPDKIVIIQKFVTDHTSGQCITLNDFVKEMQTTSRSCFIKMDIEGSETPALSCSDKLLNNFDEVMMAVCTYHCADDERRIREAFDKYTITPSKGYMVYYYDFHLAAPYLRRGLLRIQKVQQMNTMKPNTPKSK